MINYIMLKSFMNKIFSLIILGLLSFLMAKEPTLAILQSVNSNTQQLFKISNTTFLCKSYAIVGVDALAIDDKLNATCKSKIARVYLQNPSVKYYAQKKLKVMQRYHIEFIEDECLLFASGQITLSEMLLREGLAVLKPDFKNREYFGVYRKAQENAKLEKKGIWKDDTAVDCIAEIYKK